MASNKEKNGSQDNTTKIKTLTNVRPLPDEASLWYD